MLEIRVVELRTCEIKSRKILSLQVKPGEWAGYYARFRGKLPNKSKVFESRSLLR